MTYATPQAIADKGAGPSFIASAGKVIWLGPAPVELSDESVEGLFVIFEREGAARAFNELHDAYVAAGGIARASSMRGLLLADRDHRRAA